MPIKGEAYLKGRSKNPEIGQKIVEFAQNICDENLMMPNHDRVIKVIKTMTKEEILQIIN